MAFAYEYSKKIAGPRGSNDPFLTTAGTPLALSPPVVIVDNVGMQDVEVLPTDIPTATSSVYLRDAGPSPSQSRYTDGPFCLGGPKVDEKPNSPVPAGNSHVTIPTVIVTPPAVDDVPELLQELPSGGIISPRFVVLKPAPTAKEYKEAKARKVAKQMLKMQLLGADRVRRPARPDIAGCREIYESPLPFRAYQDEYNRELLTKKLNRTSNNDNISSHIRSDSSSTENSENPLSIASSDATTVITTYDDDDDDDDGPLLEGVNVELSDLHKNVVIHNTWSAESDIPIDPLHDPGYLDARRGMMDHMCALAVAKKDNNMTFCNDSSVVDDVPPTTKTTATTTCVGSSVAGVSPAANDVPSPRREHGKAMMSLLQRRIERMDYSRAGAANVNVNVNTNQDVHMYYYYYH